MRIAFRSAAFWQLERQGRLTRLFHRTHRNFVLDGDHPGHPARDCLRAGPLIRPFDYAQQSNPAAVHFRGYPMTRDREIPMKRICDFGPNIPQCAPQLIKLMYASRGQQLWQVSKNVLQTTPARVLIAQPCGCSLSPGDNWHNLGCESAATLRVQWH